MCSFSWGREGHTNFAKDRTHHGPKSFLWCGKAMTCCKPCDLYKVLAEGVGLPLRALAVTFIVEGTNMETAYALIE